jgi:hypothetical protein
MAWRDFCLRRSALWDFEAQPQANVSQPIRALASDCNSNGDLNHMGFVVDQDADGRANPLLHPRTSSLMFRIVWRSPEAASQEEYCLTDRGGEEARFEPCRAGKLWALPYPRERPGLPPYTVFTDPAQLWTIPRPFSGVEAGGAAAAGAGR